MKRNRKTSTITQAKAKAKSQGQSSARLTWLGDSLTHKLGKEEVAVTLAMIGVFAAIYQVPKLAEHITWALFICEPMFGMLLVVYSARLLYSAAYFPPEDAEPWMKDVADRADSRLNK